MDLPKSTMLAQLGAGATIESVCVQAGISREEFLAWWKRELAARVPDLTGSRKLKVSDFVCIERDVRGIPHIIATNDRDLFFGFGYATAQDRLYQIDYLRRRALGRLSEILGPE